MDKSPGFDTENWLLDNSESLISINKWQRTVDLLAKLFDAPAGFLVQHTPAGFQVTVASDQSSNPYASGTIIEPDVNIFCRKIVEKKEPLYVSDAPSDPYWDTNPDVHNDGFVSYLGVPVFWPNGKTFGTFCVMDYRVTSYDQTYLDLIHQLKDILESDLSLIEMYHQAQKLAITDTLTGINNRRGFEILAEQRLILAKRVKGALGVFYFDIDLFKGINDRYGHAVGDEVLKVVGEALNETMRCSDVVGRVGGDEFVALISLEEGDELSSMIDQFHLRMADKRAVSKLPKFTVSAGYASVDLKMNIKDIVKIADKEMLINKHSER
jgi:diguanylate cyclase (GGDEF)-like protein